MDASAALPAVVITVVLLILNAFFVAAEFAIVRVRGTQLDQLAAEGSARGRLAAHIIDHIDSYLSACQVGITAASLGLGWIGEPGVAALIAPLFGWLIERNETLFHVVSFALAFAVITYLHIVVGEQAPKYFAIQRALTTSLWLAYPLHLFYRMAYPFIWFVNASANRILTWVGIPVGPGGVADAYSDEELRMLVTASARQGKLDESERVIVGNALNFADTLVRQVMVPRTEIVAVPEELDLGGLIAIARQHRLSRFPVFRDDLDHIVGVVHVKDLVGVDRTSRAKAHDVMRKVPAIPETLGLDQALAEFRRQHAQLAIVIDEYGGTAGLVTLDDVLEELVGEVGDEFEKDAAPPIREETPGTYVVDGLVGLAELRERLHLELTDEPYDTVGGMVFGRLGRLAQVGDAVEVDGYRFQVAGVDGRRVSQVRIQRSKPSKKP
ncbi:MAG: hemolysin family protein [Candidatus Limnocylindria bacterium]